MTRPLEKIELTTILDNPKSFLNQRDKVLFYTQLFTGLRGSELTSIKIEQVATHTRLGWKVFPSLSMSKDVMKGKLRGRQINIADVLKKTLEEYLNNHYRKFADKEPKSEYYLFPSLKSKDKPLHCSTWNSILKDIFLRNEIVDDKRKLGTHTLRKNYVVALYNNPEIRSNFLLLLKCTGHQRPETLQHYVGIHADDVRDAQKNVMNEYFEQKELEKELEEELESLSERHYLEDIDFT